MEQFLSQNSLYVVLMIVLIIWGGIATFMWRLERRVADLQESARAVQMSQKSDTSTPTPSSSDR